MGSSVDVHREGKRAVSCSKDMSCCNSPLSEAPQKSTPPSALAKAAISSAKSLPTGADGAIAREFDLLELPLAVLTQPQLTLDLVFAVHYPDSPNPSASRSSAIAAPAADHPGLTAHRQAKRDGMESLPVPAEDQNPYGPSNHLVISRARSSIQRRRRMLAPTDLESCRCRSASAWRPVRQTR